ncbi:thioredoxin domain-containing protein [Candidatus Uhrbacteria bacterium]|nr:thioredoxin domain-containing protein [Candidatus Uhrbacteria bacterium]
MDKNKLVFMLPVGAALLFVVFALIGRIEAPAQKRASDQEKKSSVQQNQSALIIHDLDPTFGPKDAKVTVVEFVDFQCPYCRASHEPLMEVMEKYRTSSVRFMFRQMPIIASHPYALQAANAALCAHEQNQYLAMQNLFFVRQEQIAQDIFVKFAKELRLNLTAFNTCFAEKKYQSIIQKDLSDAEGLSLTGTPTWFFNEERVIGALTKEDMISVIETHLAK